MIVNKKEKLNLREDLKMSIKKQYLKTQSICKVIFRLSPEEALADKVSRSCTTRGTTTLYFTG